MVEKAEYTTKLHARLVQRRAEINELAAKAAEARVDERKVTRIDYKKQIEALREKQDDAFRKFEEFEQSIGDGWKDLLGGIEKVWDDLGVEIGKAAKKIS
jgi:hypothetical protein